MQPIISVIVPIYNVEDLLPKCIDSILNQSFEDFEVLLINDGSPDGSDQIIDEYVLKDSRVKGFLKENGGLSDARNYGIEKATGEYLVFIDSDDWVHEDMLTSLYDFATKNACDVVACDMAYVYPDGEEKFSSGGTYKLTNVDTNPQVILENHSACNKLYKASLFDDVRFPVGLWYEDIGCIPIVLSKALRIGKVDRILYYYFQREGSISHSPNDKVLDIYSAIDLVADYFKAHGKADVMKETLNEMYLLNGLFLSTLRISDFDARRQELLKKNVTELEVRITDWFRWNKLKSFSTKEKIILTLLKFRWVGSVLKIYDRKKA